MLGDVGSTPRAGPPIAKQQENPDEDCSHRRRSLPGRSARRRAVAAAPLAAQTLSGFTPSTDYLLQIDGQPAPTARIYWSQPSRMFLIVLKDQPTPLLLEPMSRQVKSVPLVKLATRPDGTR